MDRTRRWWILKYKGLHERRMAVDQLTKMAAVSYHHFTAFNAVNEWMSGPLICICKAQSTRSSCSCRLNTKATASGLGVIGVAILNWGGGSGSSLHSLTLEWKELNIISRKNGWIFPFSRHISHLNGPGGNSWTMEALFHTQLDHVHMIYMCVKEEELSTPTNTPGPTPPLISYNAWIHGPIGPFYFHLLFVTLSEWA